MLPDQPSDPSPGGREIGVRERERERETDRETDRDRQRERERETETERERDRDRERQTERERETERETETERERETRSGYKWCQKEVIHMSHQTKLATPSDDLIVVIGDELARSSTTS